MKETLLKFLDDWWAVFWFVFGMLFFAFAIIAFVNHEDDNAKACIGICLACHARSEVKILQRKIEKK